MTVIRVKTCACGHAQDWHEGSAGRCTYGHGHVMGGCSCPQFGRRRRKDAASAPAAGAKIDPRVSAIDEIILGLEHLKAALTKEPNSILAVAASTPKQPRAIVIRTTLDGDGQYERGAKYDHSSPKLRAGERRMLAVAARHHPGRLTRAQLATLAVFSSKGGTFLSYLSVLRKADYLDEDDAGIWITAAGRAVTGITQSEPMSRDEIIKAWHSVLRRGERVMLNVVLSHRALTRVLLAQLAGMESSGGTFSSYLSVLRKNGLIVTKGNDVTLGTALTEAK